MVSASTMDKKTTYSLLSSMYTKNMKKHIVRSLPPEFLTHPAYIRAVVLAGVYLCLVITQLFTYEKFPEIVTGYNLPGGVVVGALLSGVIPLLEIASLPYLISMRVSRRTRRLSKYAVIALPALWLCISIWLTVTADMTTESGLLGATIPTGSGLWLVAFSLLLLWSAWLVIRELPQRRSK